MKMIILPKQKLVIILKEYFEQVFMNFTKLGSEGGLYIATGKKN